MCAVVRYPFWAGWQYDHRAHPSLTIQIKISVNIALIRENLRLNLCFDELDLHRVWNNPLLVSLVQQPPDGLATAVGIVQG